MFISACLSGASVIQVLAAGNTVRGAVLGNEGTPPSSLNSNIEYVFFFPPLDFIHKITVQASPGLEKRRNSPDLGSPSIGPRFRAIQREFILYD